MKFVHIADVHFDRPFVNLSSKENIGEIKRLEQRKIFKDIIDYIKENDIEVLFISGDLYEEKYVKKSTIDYINNLFREIPNTKIFISPGNHDPKIKESYYNKYTWSNNVKIFDSKIEKIELKDDINIYGFGFNDYYCTDSGIEEFNILPEDKNKINILEIHASLDGASLEEKQYNSISTKLLEDKGFDYVALGHIHKSNFNSSDKNNIIYPGSPISLRFEGNIENGMIVGNITKENLDLKYIPLKQQSFREKTIDVSSIYSEEELIEEINDIKNIDNNFLKLILEGKRNFEIDLVKIKKLISNDDIIRIKDKTKLGIDLSKLENEFTLRGMFAKEMSKKLANAKTEEEKRTIEKAIEIGLESLI